MDLGEYVSDKDAFQNSFGEGLKFVFDGKILAAPMDVTANGLIYNKTAFEKAGVAVPQSEDEIWTWDEWKEAMKTVMEKATVSMDWSMTNLHSVLQRFCMRREAVC